MMRALRIADAFDAPAIPTERLHEIVARLECSEPGRDRFGQGYYSAGGQYEVQLTDRAKIYSPLILTETEISAVQAVFQVSVDPKSALINAKLDEAERRIEEARDYAAELRGRTTGGMPGRKLVW